MVHRRRREADLASGAAWAKVDAFVGFTQKYAETAGMSDIPEEDPRHQGRGEVTGERRQTAGGRACRSRVAARRDLLPARSRGWWQPGKPAVIAEIRGHASKGVLLPIFARPRLRRATSSMVPHVPVSAD